MNWVLRDEQNFPGRGQNSVDEVTETWKCADSGRNKQPGGSEAGLCRRVGERTLGVTCDGPRARCKVVWTFGQRGPLET